ncbi:MAG: peptidoglycan editing factor PgeF [Peptococcaceae bacterium]|nr:peptidoglycan editing factor PgeF [Peptococcaceae bacterium]
MLTPAPQGDLKFYTFPSFGAAGLVVHGFTTRAGGVSEGPYAGLNTAFHVGDRPENVLANRALACRALGIDSRHLVAGVQVHGEGIAVVDGRDRGRGALSQHDALPGTDALVTGTPAVPLASFYADCVPVFLLDPVRGVVALAHAGWKGTVLMIGKKTVEKMTEVFGTDPGHCLAGIGPSIGPSCYEVDGRVMGPLRESFTCWEDLAGPVSPGKWRLDLWEANRRALLAAGLQEENIVVARLCTSCHNHLFFSYRAQGGTAGRMASLIMLKA